jgi:RimJ/RimL family protein N-acetyltransferase
MEFEVPKMKKRMLLALMCLTIQNNSALADSADTEWFGPNGMMTKWYGPNGMSDHNNDPEFDFLLGDWESTDPNVCFKESWLRSATGTLIAIRTQHPNKTDTEYDV